MAAIKIIKTKVFEGPDGILQCVRLKDRDEQGLDNIGELPVYLSCKHNAL